MKPATEELTETQSKVLKFCRHYHRMEDNFPTLKRISDFFGWTSLTTAKHHLDEIVRKGKLQRTDDLNVRFPKSNRSLETMKYLEEGFRKGQQLLGSKGHSRGRKRKTAAGSIL